MNVLGGILIRLVKRLHVSTLPERADEYRCLMCRLVGCFDHQNSHFKSKDDLGLGTELYVFFNLETLGLEYLHLLPGGTSGPPRASELNH